MILKEFGITDQQLKLKAEELGIDVSQYEDEDEELLENSNVVELQVEYVDGEYFAYRYETDEFIAQSSTPTDLLEKLIKVFPPNTRVNIDIERGGKYFKNLA